MSPAYVSRRVPSIAQKEEDPDRTFLLLAQADSSLNFVRHLGWIKASHVLTSPNALTDDNKIHRKALLIWKPEAQFSTDVTLVQGFEPGAARTTYKLLTIFYVYSKTRTHWLLGVTPRLEEPSQVKGWASVERLFPWSTREALEWDRTPRVAKGRVYYNPKDAYKAARSPDLGGGPPGVVDEPGPVGTTYTYDPGEIRFPMLGYTEEGLPQPPEPEKDPESNNTLLRVGAVGKFGKFDPAQIAELRRNVEVAADRLSRSQILFVIDNSTSMEKYFPIVAKVVRSVLVQETARRPRDELEQVDAPRTQFAVAFYNDDERVVPSPYPPPFETTPLKDITRFTDDDFRRIEAKPCVDNLGNRELVFEGIRRAINAAGFDKSDEMYGARRLLILIGDMADDHRGPKQGGIGALTERDVADMLLQYKDAPIEFFGVKVGMHTYHDSTSGEVREITDAIDFKTQIDTIARIIRNTRDKYRTLGDPAQTVEIPYDAPDQLGPFQKILKQRLENFAEETEALRKLYSDLAYGVVKGELTTAEKERLKEDLNIPVAEIAKQPGSQKFEEGFVWQYEPWVNPVTKKRERQVRSCFLMTEREVQALAKLLADLTNKEPPTDGPSLSELIVREVNILVGEHNQERATLGIGGRPIKFDPKGKEGLASYFKVRGLNYRNPILNMDPVHPDPETFKANLGKLREQFNGLQRLLASPKKAVADPKDPTQRIFPRWWRIPDNPQYYVWLDAEELP
jgi:hypothetical protein